MSMRPISAGRTDTGRVRRHNEDAILVRDDVGLWVVADGLGGHSAGDYASTMIVERLSALPRSGDLLDFVETIEETLNQINLDLRATADQRGVDLIGSTVVVVLQGDDYILCGWIGDSRCYCYEDGRLRQITRDHAHGAEDEVTQFGGRGAPQAAGAGALTRAVGAEDEAFVDWVVASNKADVQFLLCSDGINKEITDAELEAEFRREQHPQDLLDSLFDLAMNRGARDNVSAVVLRMRD